MGTDRQTGWGSVREGGARESTERKERDWEKEE